MSPEELPDRTNVMVVAQCFDSPIGNIKIMADDLPSRATDQKVILGWAISTKHATSRVDWSDTKMQNTRKLHKAMQLRTDKLRRHHTTHRFVSDAEEEARTYEEIYKGAYGKGKLIWASEKYLSGDLCLLLHALYRINGDKNQLVEVSKQELTHLINDPDLWFPYLMYRRKRDFPADCNHVTWNGSTPPRGPVPPRPFSPEAPAW